MIKGIKIQIRFSDIDVLGHVNNAVYLSYFEVARVIFFSNLMGEDWDWHRNGVVLRKNVIEYIKPVVLNDVPEIFIHTQRIGKKSFTLEYDLKVKNELRSTGSSVLVSYDSEKMISKDIPAKMKGVLSELFRDDI